jgi:hypothetical protein
MKNQKVILRFDEFSTSERYALRRIVGTVTADSIIRLLDVADLEADPREAKVGDVTDEIQETLEKTPHLFPFKSKGLLLAAGECNSLERSRFELLFEDPQIQGVLDGAHNLLAIALHMLGKVMRNSDDKALRSVKRWEQVPDLWHANRDKIEAIKGEITFLTPVEVIFPREGVQGRDDFQDAILQVAQARNNNAELTEETKANKAGFYEAIKGSIDKTLVEQIEWKTNDGGRIKVRDLVALAWVPISRIERDLPGKKDFNPVSIYRNKGQCVAAFNKLMESDEISKKTKGDIRELTDPAVKSAIALLKDMPRLFDLVYQLFPDAYNHASQGFGRIGSVFIWDPKKANSKDPKYLSRPPRTRFYQTECTYDFPDGFITPLVWALRELMEYKDGVVAWKVNSPDKFLTKTLPKTLEVYYGMIQMAGYDPQKVGKTSATYHLAANDFRSRLPQTQDMFEWSASA